MNRTILALIIFLSATTAALAQGDYWYYDRDGSVIELEVYDSLVAVRLDPESWPGMPQAFAYDHDFLDNDFQCVSSPGDFWTFAIVAGYTLDQVLMQLRSGDAVLMANPVIRNCFDMPSYLSNRLLVLYNESVTAGQIDSLNQTTGFTLVDSLGTDHVFYLLDFEDESWSDMTIHARAYYQSGICYVVEPSTMFQGVPLSDPYYDEQWHLENTCQTGGTPDADVDWELARPYHHDDLLTVVAAIDNGFEQEHEDLEEYWCYWSYDAVGYFIENPTPDLEPWRDCTDIRSHYWHGTTVTGVTKALTDNSIGLAGVNSDVRIMPVKYEDAYGRTNQEVIWDAIDWATSNHGPARADIFNISATVPYSAVIEARLQWVYEIGMPVICAVGCYVTMAYPASSPYTLAVGGTDHNDDWVPYSHTGPEVDLVAPADNLITIDLMGAGGLNPAIYTCDGNQNYVCGIYGTSYSTPIVSGIAAMLFATRRDLFDPAHGNVSVELLYDVLRKSAERDHYGVPSSSLIRVDDYVGWGRVNAERALLAVVRGDANNDSAINVTDAVYILAYIFVDGPPPQPRVLCDDADGNGIVNISDSVKLIGYIFGSDPLPPIGFIYD